jgi:hypothetical protein
MHTIYFFSRVVAVLTYQFYLSEHILLTKKHTSEKKNIPLHMNEVYQIIQPEAAEYYGVVAVARNNSQTRAGRRGTRASQPEDKQRTTGGSRWQLK